MKHILALALGLVNFAALAADDEAGFKPLMDGKTFAGSKIATENTNTFRIEDGAFVANGNRSHLFYVGDEQPFKSFHLKVDVMTEPNSNGGIYFHTKYQAQGWPKAGFECQVNNTTPAWIFRLPARTLHQSLSFRLARAQWCEQNCWLRRG
jgi:hypothetical protein